MAATVSAWAKPGAWALDSEENETELLQQQKEDADAANGHSNGAETTEFPSLAAAAAKKTKKKKAQTLSLQEFTTYGAAKPSAAQPKGLTPDELLVLPTGPRQRSAEELDRNKLGGGFRSYGLMRLMIGCGKKSSINNGFERRDRGERGGFFSDSQSRADEADNWALNKSFVPSEPRRHERRGGFGLESGNGGADSSNWVKRKEEEGRRIGGAFDSLRERRGGLESNGADSESWGRKREDGSVSGRPRLNLQPRTLPVVEGQKSDNASVVKPKGSNPFGEARPREDVLKEKGQDWKEIEEKLESTKIREVVSAGPSDAPKRSFWSGNGRDRSRLEDKTERAWRKQESADLRPQ
ncbi:UNVERIFIED_CONTAM: Eukaryotic translation initiation factor 4B3, partial [Sesamum radiatum]